MSRSKLWILFIIATAAMMFGGSAEAWTIAAAAIITMMPTTAPRALPAGWNMLHCFPNELSLPAQHVTRPARL